MLAQAIDEFEGVFGRRPAGPFPAEQTADADLVLLAAGTMAHAAAEVVRARRARGEKVGLVRAKLFRPFLRDALAAAVGPASRVAVLDRDHSPGSGGIFWNEAVVSLAGRPGLVVQDYIVGLGGSDVSPALIEQVVDDLLVRDHAAPPLFFPEAA